jgi:hypothetical protein
MGMRVLAAAWPKLEELLGSGSATISLASLTILNPGARPPPFPPSPFPPFCHAPPPSRSIVTPGACPPPLSPSPPPFPELPGWPSPGSQGGAGAALARKGLVAGWWSDEHACHLRHGE